MTGGVSTLPRESLARALGGDPRVIRAFEEEAQKVAAVDEQSGLNVAATEALQDATVLTLSANEALTNERIFRPRAGVKASDDGTYLNVEASDEVAHVSGGFSVYLFAEAPVTLTLPETGTLVTQEHPVLSAPRVTDLGNYANDAAAAGGGVPVGGIYRNGSALQVRVA